MDETSGRGGEGVTGESDNDYSVYLDVYYTDDTPLYGQMNTNFDNLSYALVERYRICAQVY